MSTVLRVSIHIYGISQEIDGKTFIGLSLLFIEMKEFCEARGKLETSSNFQIYPGKTDDPPNSKLPEVRLNSSLFNAVNESHSKQSTNRKI